MDHDVIDKNKYIEKDWNTAMIFLSSYNDIKKKKKSAEPESNQRPDDNI